MANEVCPHCGKTGCLWAKQHREPETCSYCKLALAELWKQKAAEIAQTAAREFWERAALEAFTARVTAQGADYLPRQNIIDVATYADTMLDEWRKRFDPRAAADAAKEEMLDLAHNLNQWGIL